jgi:hypothetical protein
VLHLVADAVEAVPAADDDRDLAAVGVLGHVGVGVRRDEEHACGPVAVVPDLVPASRPARKRHDVAFRQNALAVVHPHSRLPAQHDEELLGRVVEVVDELRRSGLELPQRGAERAVLGSHQPACPDAAAPARDVVPDVRGLVAHAGRLRASVTGRSGEAPSGATNTACSSADTPKSRRTRLRLTRPVGSSWGEG